MTQVVQSKNGSKKLWWVLGCLGCFGGLLFLGGVAAIVESATAKPTQGATQPQAAQTASIAVEQKHLDPIVDSSQLESGLASVRDAAGIESAGISFVEGKAKLDLVISPKVVVDGNNFILTTAGKINSALKAFQSSVGFDRIWLVVVTLKAPLVDRYGNTTQEPVLRYMFEGSELAKINWNDMVQQRLLEFAQPEWLHLEGARMAKEYALEDHHAELAPTFCRIAIYGR